MYASIQGQPSKALRTWLRFSRRRLGYAALAQPKYGAYLGAKP